MKSNRLCRRLVPIAVVLLAAPNVAAESPTVHIEYQASVDEAGQSAAITSVEAYESEMRELKIDVFGDVAVVTYHPHRSVTKDGRVRRYSTRQSLVFLRTPKGWKIVHEHQSGMKQEEQDSAPD